MQKLTLILFFSLSLLHDQSAMARELIIVVSPYVEQAKAKTQAKDLLKFLTQLEPGDKAFLLDGYNLSSIGKFHIPDNKLYNSPKARLKVNGTAVGALLRFADNASRPDVENAPSVQGAVRLPQLLRHIAANFPPEERREVIIIGSPFYDDPNEPGFSMAGTIIPSDGHILASRRQTPFGTADSAELLSQMRVHLAFGGEHIMLGDQHRYFIERFWTLYIEQQGGRLVTFTGDLPTLFRKIKNNAKAPRHDYKLDASEKLEMILLRPQTTKQSIYERPVTHQSLPQQFIQRAEQVELGLSWDCKSCDLDLYAKPLPSAEILYFNNTTSTQGRYWKDYLQSPRATSGKESIEFGVPLDLRVLQIVVNFYRGDAPEGVRGELRLAVKDKTYAMTFHIDAQEGNQGTGVIEAFEAGRSLHSQTLIINPLSFW